MYCNGTISDLDFECFKAIANWYTSLVEYRAHNQMFPESDFDLLLKTKTVRCRKKISIYIKRNKKKTT